ncbi:alpha-2-glucosyltransferase Alg10 [Pyronema domesticum]|uniref:Dol-P-Glc:Glc(2)Man(9)GlcNAc(2)-PP-Dol alpha-1,2-glucosyltransferase n=1 Tax=Pyronema omphalodes (strain CBS 100304) TaxID=1076935 RepID=U4KUC8_PYROM|nr:alpha-2-glucosyltransferase Alg10 [Pyronema domesticum]CCX04311.1 Similar to Putative Dol-P-Glc:Glc(2)Man(9)GlcNAc(2)-PP-Dol alpha-1,2-glucosyltransferase; acc. no. Q3UGP8 [Pyronema omphalodes CBS 100304]
MHPLALRLSVLAIILAATSKKIGRIIPEPYLDEVFHIPQAQAYCRNAFDVWDPKLTTPAGLYILSYPLRFFDACSPQFLRGINAFGIAYALPVVVYLIWQTLHEEGSALDGIASQVAMNVALFPVLYFFGGLYYTDVWSTIFVMAAYLATLRMKPWVAGVFAWISLWFRQTNIVWVAFMAGVYAVCRVAELEEEHTGKSAAEEQKKPDTKENENPGWLKEVKLHDPNISGNIKSIDFVRTPLSILVVALRYLPSLLVSMIPYILVLLSFVVFLVSNNFTIVLGDATAHQASIHIPQLLYFTAATTFFSFPLYLPLVPRMIRRLPSPITIILLAAMSYAVYYNTVLHPYLMADNRHYAFYVFRKLLLRFPPYSLLVPAPAYLVAMYLQREALNVTLSWAIFYVAATTITLISAPLVEPRYFIIAWTVWRVHVKEMRMWVLLMEAAWLVVVNAVTIYLFLMKPFEWAHEPGVLQRFMW